MTQATMNIFQTYKALMLKKAWEQDLKALKNKTDKMIYKKALPIKNFIGLSIEITILFVLYLMIIAFKDMGTIVLMMLPFTILLILYSVLYPVATILVPLALYNLIKIEWNKRRNRSKAEIVRIKQQTEAIQTNLSTIENGLKKYSIVPEHYQTEKQLQTMMGKIKSGEARDDRHAVYMHTLEHEEAIRRKRSQQQQMKQPRFKKNEKAKHIFTNLVLTAFVIRLLRKK